MKLLRVAGKLSAGSPPRDISKELPFDDFKKAVLSGTVHNAKIDALAKIESHPRDSDALAVSFREPFKFKQVVLDEEVHINVYLIIKPREKISKLGQFGPESKNEFYIDLHLPYDYLGMRDVAHDEGTVDEAVQIMIHEVNHAFTYPYFTKDPRPYKNFQAWISQPIEQAIGGF